MLALLAPGRVELAVAAGGARRQWVSAPRRVWSLALRGGAALTARPAPAAGDDGSSPCSAWRHDLAIDAVYWQTTARLVTAGRPRASVAQRCSRYAAEQHGVAWPRCVVRPSPRAYSGGGGSSFLLSLFSPTTTLSGDSPRWRRGRVPDRVRGGDSVRLADCCAPPRATRVRGDSGRCLEARDPGLSRTARRRSFCTSSRPTGRPARSSSGRSGRSGRTTTPR